MWGLGEIVKMNEQAAKVHFHSSLENFCGTTEQYRRFSFDSDKVTCPACKAKAAMPKLASVVTLYDEQHRRYVCEVHGSRVVRVLDAPDAEEVA